jgi:alkylation response protein AidB-like acyl-CoA dehydrogenase
MRGVVILAGIDPDLERAGRVLREAKLYEIGAGTSEIWRMVIGRALFEATA